MEILFFSKSGCGPCRIIEDEINKINDVPEMEIINPYEYPQAAKRYNVDRLPYIVVKLDNGDIKKGYGTNGLDIIREVVKGG